MVARAHAGEHVAGVERLEDGLTNAVYRVTAIGSRESWAVRVFTNHHQSMAKETAVLDALHGRLPVPERLAIHLADRMLPHACVIYHCAVRDARPLPARHLPRRHAAAVVFAALVDRAALDSRTVLVHGDAARLGACVPWWRAMGCRKFVSLRASLLRTTLLRVRGGYRAAGGALPADWHLVSRLLDATRLVEIVDRAEDLPAVFRECQDLIETLVNEAGNTASAL